MRRTESGMGRELTGNGSMREAFKAVFDRIRLPANPTFDHYAPLASELFTAGVAHFVHHGLDSYLQKIGRTTWWMTNQKRVLAVLTNDIEAAAIHFGVPTEVARKTYFDPDQMFVLLAAKKDPSSMVFSEVAYVLIPSAFVDQARSQPVLTLGKMAWVGSQVRDMANGRLYIDGKNIAPRAQATEAHFLKGASKSEPALLQVPYVQQILKSFPEGIASLQPSMLYQGTDQSPQNARMQ